MKILISYPLGDFIALSGAIVKMAQEQGGIAIACPQESYVSVSSFFVNHPNAKVLGCPYVNQTPHSDGTKRVKMEIAPPAEWNITEILGFDKTAFNQCVNDNGEPWARYYYRKLGIDFSYRYSMCPIREASKKVKQLEWNNDTILVHDDDRYQIDKRRIPCGKIASVVNDGTSILRYCHAVSTACRLDVIDSCIMNLAECLNPTGELWLHRYARPGVSKGRGDCSPRYKWNEII